MKAVKHFLSLAISIALALTFSACDSGGGGGGNNASYTCKLSNGNCIETTSVSDCSQAGGSVVDVCQGQNGNNSSSSKSNVTLSSSSKLSSSSSSTTSGIQQGIIYGASVSYGGETYQSVVIGTQTWMARNLNYNASGSVCYGEGDRICNYRRNPKETCLSYTTLTSAQIQANCNTYGRLYDWATAMNLPSSCNSNSCSNQVSSKHRGICPSGWHIPSDEEWTMLRINANGELGLRATSGWKDEQGNSINGTDKYGFSALPGGIKLPDNIGLPDEFSGVFAVAGNIGSWWSANENTSNVASRWDMKGDDDESYKYGSHKAYSFSIRCIKD